MSAALRGRLLALAVVLGAMLLTAVVLGAFGDDDVGPDATSATTGATVVEDPVAEDPDEAGDEDEDGDPETSPTSTDGNEETDEGEESDGGDAADPSVAPTPLVGSYSVEVVDELPGDPTAYVQGLELLDDGTLLRSDGRYGESDRNVVDPDTGEVLRSTPLEDTLFAEGATVVGDEVFQLTWQEGVVEVADLATLETVRTMTYGGEGWGLCWNGESLVMSDGSAVLTLRDPDTFAVLGSVTVLDAGGAEIGALNELECVGGQVLANRYGSDQLIVIDAASGAVDAVVDASSIRPEGVPPTGAEDFDYVLNGIAWDETDDTYLLTGKWWPATFRVRIVPA